MADQRDMELESRQSSADELDREADERDRTADQRDIDEQMRLSGWRRPAE